MSAMAEPSTEITPLQQVSTQIRTSDFRRQIAAALPEGLTVQRFERVVLTALMEDQTKTSDLRYQIVNADRATLYSAVIKCAQDGLLPNGREAALVVFKGKVSYMPMVGGFRKIAAEYGWTIRAKAVYAADHFVFSEEPPSIEHRPAGHGVDRGNLIAVYAVATHKDGRRQQVVMHPDDVAARKAVAKTDNVWRGWTAEMWEKTAAKNIFADLPLDPAEKERVSRVAAASDPQASTTAMYGTGAQLPSPASTPALAAGPAAAPPVVVEAPGGTEAADTTANATPEGYNPAAAIQTDDEIVHAAQQAGKLVPPDGQHAAAGRSLSEILALGEPGTQWFRRFTNDTSVDPVFHAALLDFTRVYLPDVYAEAADSDQIEF